MANRFNARGILAESFRNRLGRIRGVEPGGNWVGIQAFGLTFNESLPDIWSLQCNAQVSGSAAGIFLAVPAANPTD
jgi:hypothetical protein